MISNLDSMLSNQASPLAEISISWLPAWSTTGFVGIAVAAAVAWLALRYVGGASVVPRNFGLWALRGITLTVLLAILLGPTIVDEQPGAVARPAMLYLLDGSQSMQLGEQRSRWEQSLQFIADAQLDPTTADNVQSFRFGHRLEPLTKASGGSAQNDKQASGSTSSTTAQASIAPPNASDSRLGEALRQLLPQVSARQTAGVVLLSDGRVRATESVERLAEIYHDAQVPLHVVPIGQASGAGDIAVVSLVVPSRVRKMTENELQVFFRSYGFDGQRTTLRVVHRDQISDGPAADLASVPITLTGGAQSASLTFRVDDQAKDLAVIVAPLEGELTAANNRVETHVEIDRTKIRVLYVENAATAVQTRGNLLGRILSLGGSAPAAPGAVDLTVPVALQADEDMECVTLLSSSGRPPVRVDVRDAAASQQGFPNTRAELFAYDCVILSDVGPGILEPEQLQWLAQWVEGRGGGLIVSGAAALQAGDWSDGPLLPLLPIQLDDSPAEPRTTADLLPAHSRRANVDIVAPQHPVWRLRWEQRTNDQILASLPNLYVSSTAYQAKPTADVLAEVRDDGRPTMLAHRVGRGRVFVTTASLGGQAFSELSEQWGPQPERVAAKLWRNLVYWVTEGSSTGRRRLMAWSDKRFYRPGEPLSIRATAYDEGARRTDQYRLWAMFEPTSLDDLSLYSPLLWPDNVVRDSGEVSPRLAWGEELMLAADPETGEYRLDLMLSESRSVGDGGLRIEMTAYEGEPSPQAYDHGTQVDSTSLAIQILSDPFEQQNPLPNHELLSRLASLSGGQVLQQPDQLAELLANRTETLGPPDRDLTPAWSRWWIWMGLLGLLTSEWIWRKISGYA